MLGILLALVHTGLFLNFILWTCCLPELVSIRTGGIPVFSVLTVSWGQWEDFLLLRIRECSSVVLSFMTSTEDSKSCCITLLPVLCSATLSLHILPLSPGIPDSILLTYAEIGTEPGLDMLGKML